MRFAQFQFSGRQTGRCRLVLWYREHKVRRVRLEFRVLKVILVLRVLLVLRVRRVMLVRRDRLVFRDLKGFRVL